MLKDILIIWSLAESLPSPSASTIASAGICTSAFVKFKSSGTINITSPFKPTFVVLYSFPSTFNVAGVIKDTTYASEACTVVVLLLAEGAPFVLLLAVGPPPPHPTKKDAAIAE